MLWKVTLSSTSLDLALVLDFPSSLGRASATLAPLSSGTAGFANLIGDFVLPNKFPGGSCGEAAGRAEYPSSPNGYLGGGGGLELATTQGRNSSLFSPMASRIERCLASPVSHFSCSLASSPAESSTGAMLSGEIGRFMVEICKERALPSFPDRITSTSSPHLGGQRSQNRGHNASIHGWPSTQYLSRSLVFSITPKGDLEKNKGAQDLSQNGTASARFFEHPL